MDYFKLILNSTPHILFAHNYQTHNYSMDLKAEPNFMEIIHVEQGAIQNRKADGSLISLPAQSITVSLRNQEEWFESAESPHRHATVGFHLLYQAEKITQDDILPFVQQMVHPSVYQKDWALLPEYLLPDEADPQIKQKLQTIIRCFLEGDEARILRCNGLILELLADLSTTCIRTILKKGQDPNPGAFVYSQRAIRYIANHIQQKITVDEIARELEISSGYLSHLFKATTGQTLVTYINHAKIDRVKELLMMNNAITLKEAAKNVGIEDENYLSRIFKQYTGLSIREFRTLRVAL